MLWKLFKKKEYFHAYKINNLLQLLFNFLKKIMKFESIELKTCSSEYLGGAPQIK